MNDTELRLACLELADGRIQNAEQMYSFVVGTNKTTQEDDTTDIHEITAKEMMGIHTAVNEGNKAARDHYLNKFIDQRELLFSGKPITRATLVSVMNLTLHQAVKTAELERVVNVLIDALDVMPTPLSANYNIAKLLSSFKIATRKADQ